MYEHTFCIFFLCCLQILPTAQRLLDELLSSQSTAINTVCGAPGMGDMVGTTQEKYIYFPLNLIKNLAVVKNNLHMTLT